VRGVWDLIVACKGTVVVAWRRGRLRAGLAGLLAAAAMAGVVGALWLLSGNGSGDDASAPIDDGAMPDQRDADAAATGQHGTVPAVPLRPPGSLGAGSTDAAGAWSAGDRGPGSGAGPGSERSEAFQRGDGTGADGSSVPVGSAAASGANRAGSSSPSIPATTAPVRSTPPGGATTTTSLPEAPPDDPGAEGLGGLLGGVLDVLGLG
jgi:hypothetical protein